MLSKLGWIAFSVVVLFSCKKDKDTSSPSPTAPIITNFTKIVVLENVSVHLAHGPAQTFSITGIGDLSKVKRSVANEILTVSDKGSNTQNVVITIQHPNIEHIAVRNNGTVKFTNDFFTTSNLLTITGFDNASILNSHHLNISNLNIELRNSAKLALADLNAQKLQLKLTDGTHCNIAGASRHQSIELDNGSRYNLDFPVAGWSVSEPALGDSCWVSANNGSKAWVFPIHYLKAEANNGSIIYYKGTPVKLDETITNGSNVTNKE